LVPPKSMPKRIMVSRFCSRFGHGDARHLLTRGSGFTDYCRN
jgi:hypothetical protein